MNVNAGKEGLGNKIIHFIPLTTILHIFIHFGDKKGGICC
jgi:hypothetical protein